MTQPVSVPPLRILTNFRFKPVLCWGFFVPWLVAWLAFAEFVASAVQAAAVQSPMDASFLRDYAETRSFRLGRPVNPQPTPDGQAVLFLRAGARIAKMSLYEFDPATGETREFLTPDQILKGTDEKLSAEEKARRERMRVSVGGITRFEMSEDGSLVLVGLSGKLYVVERRSSEPVGGIERSKLGEGAAPHPNVRETNSQNAAGPAIQELTTGPGTILDPKFSPDANSVAYVRDHDVYVFNLAEKKERRLTFGGTATISQGLAEFVAQEEMGRFSGYWWSPDSRYIVYQRANASGVETWHVADPAKPDQPPHPSYYPRPGKANVEVRLGVVPVRGGKTVWIQWDATRYPYLAKVEWSKGGPLSLAVQTRDQTELVLLRAEPKNGRTTKLLTERDSAWLNLDQQVPRWLEDGSGFLWTSERAGGLQLELRATNGILRRVVVPPSAGYQALVDVDEPNRRVIFRASPDPTQSHLHRVSLDGGEAQPLTRDAGMHSAVFAKNHSLSVRQFSAPEAMPQSLVYRGDGTLVGELPSVAEGPPFVPKAEIVKVGDGGGFFAEVIRPREFSSVKRYPVIVDVYGGPHANVVQASMGTRLLGQWLADRGFVVVSIDGRGTPGRGRDWERAIFKKFGSVPLDDQVSGLRALAARFPELDLERVGIVGWSFGGYMSALAVLKRPDVFKAGVAGAPVVEWEDYDTHYTERYLGVPDQDAQAYRESSLLTYADKLERPLLIVHGTADDNVYFRHSLKLANALFRAGREFEMLPLSGLTHMVPDPVVTEQLWSRIARFFHEHLGGPR